MNVSSASAHLREVSRRLKFTNRVQIAVWAVRNGLA